MRFEDAITFAVNTLKDDERFANVDLSPNSATFNLSVLPFAMLSKATWDVVEWIQRYLLFSDPSQLGEEQLDNIGKMLMAPPRRTANSVTVEVSMYFKSGNAEPIVVNTTDTFRTSSNAVGYPLREYILVYGSMPKVTIDGAEYRAAKITVKFDGSGVVPAGAVTQTSVIANGLAFVRNENASSAPIAAETNEEYFTTIQNSLSTRNDVNSASIIANYKSAYDIFDILAVGFGDPEMQRDISVASRGWSGHIGSRIDAYIKSPLVDAEFTTNNITDKGGNVYSFDFARYSGINYNGTVCSWRLCEGNIPVTPIVLIDWEKSSIGGLDYSKLAKKPNGDVDYSVEILPDIAWGKNYRYSIYERLRISVRTTERATDNTVTLSYKTYSNMENIQESANSSRLLNCDLLFKSFIPVQVKKLVVVYEGSLDEEAWTAILANRINTWSSPTNLRFNELFDGIGVPVKFEETWEDRNNLPYKLADNGVITETCEGKSGIPTYAVLHMDNIDGSTITYLSTRQIYPIPVEGLSATYRTCRYFINPEDIQFKKLNW